MGVPFQDWNFGSYRDEMTEIGDQPPDGPGEIDLGRLADPPAVDPGKLPGARHSAADHLGQVTQRLWHPAGRIGDHDQPDHLDVGNEAAGPLAGGRLRRSQASYV